MPKENEHNLETSGSSETAKESACEKESQPEMGESTSDPQTPPAPPQPKLEDLKFTPSKISNSIFVVSSGAEEMAKTVTVFLEKNGLKPIPTLNSASAPKPLAQKVLDYPGVSFAVVLLSGEEFVYPKEGKPGEAVLRAAQKVVFEFGFWLGRLGRERVAAVYSEQKTFRPPTEFFDAAYIPFDKRELWKSELLRRLKSAGLPIK